MAFLGEYLVSVTEGGRVVIPKKMRENISGHLFVLTKGFDVCLAGYDKKDWDTRSQDLLAVSLIENEHINRRRNLFSGANVIEIDEQGRFVIPKVLIDYIGGETKSVVVIGVGDHFEIWNIDNWNEYKDKSYK